MTRRQLSVLALAPLASASPSNFPAEDPATTLEMVGASHGKVDRVRALLGENPGLAKASIDWGFGDWETALGAASHVGNRPIAEMLLNAGALPTIFSAAMMGDLDLLKSFISAKPGIQSSYGPHGITLLSHARAGGENAAAVVEYLKGLGGADVPLPVKPLTDKDRDALPGRYVFGSGSDDHFVIDLKDGRLGVNRPGAPARRLLFHEGGLVFYPSGAPWAKLAFEEDHAGFRLTGIGAPVAAKRERGA